MITSLGHHTFEMYRTLIYTDMDTVFKSFNNDPRILPISSTDERTGIKYYSMTYKKDIGITWKLTFATISRSFVDFFDETRPCTIKVKINPKLLAGIRDYVTAADQSYLDTVIQNFNREASRISKLLGTFDQYSFNRVDYCINFDLRELCIGCTVKQMMKLLKRGNHPPDLIERLNHYDHSHRKKAGDNLYLKNNSVNVNCYGKHAQLKKEFPDCPNIDDSKDVVRFEIQCKYPKVYSMGKIIKSRTGTFPLIQEMLSDDLARTIITKYYQRIVGYGDYYSLELARRQVEACNFHPKKTKRLIDVLEHVNQCRGISKAMAMLQCQAREDFKRSIRELNYIGVNPVTIPRELNIKHIPNLLTAYEAMMSAQVNQDRLQQAESKLLDDYFQENTKHKKKKGEI